MYGLRFLSPSKEGRETWCPLYRPLQYLKGNRAAISGIAINVPRTFSRWAVNLARVQGVRGPPVRLFGRRLVGCNSNVAGNRFSDRPPQAVLGHTVLKECLHFVALSSHSGGQ